MKKIIFALALTIMIAGCVQETYDPTVMDFAGMTIHFRANLDEARHVQVYPNETSLKYTLLNNEVEGIGIAYIPSATENSFFLAASVELAYKLTVVNKYYFNITKSIESIPVNSSLEALSMASSRRPVIMLMGPSQTNQTIVNAAGSFITVQGNSFDESNRTYNDLDLATDKLLLVLMKRINI
jgi:hypothetical protein